MSIDYSKRRGEVLFVERGEFEYHSSLKILYRLVAIERRGIVGVLLDAYLPAIFCYAFLRLSYKLVQGCYQLHLS